MTRAYAIVRVEDGAGEETPFEFRMKVKRIVWDQDLANSEVDRLNAIRRSPCHYFWQVTHVDDVPGRDSS